jgi:hypothetical protein
MPRPIANPDQHLRAYQLWRTGLGPTAIEEKLSEEFGKAVSDRTIAIWVKGFKGLNPVTVDLDAPFEWYRMDKYGLPWEASSFFMDMMTLWYLERTWLAESGPGNAVSFTPTVREAIWWWRLHQAAPEVGQQIGSLWDIQLMAAQFVYREMALELLGIPMETADLEARLVLKPWLDQEHHEDYHRAINAGVIPPLKEGAHQEVSKLIVAAQGRPVERLGWLNGSSGGMLQGHTELLPSQQRDVVQANPQLLKEGQYPSDDEINRVLWGSETEG